MTADNNVSDDVGNDVGNGDNGGNDTGNDAGNNAGKGDGGDAGGEGGGAPGRGRGGGGGSSGDRGGGSCIFQGSLLFIVKIFNWRNLEGYPAQPGLIRSSVHHSVHPSVRAKRGIWSKRVFKGTNGDFSFHVR